MADEHLFSNASGRPIVRVGDTVRRPVEFWTPAVHGLLRHLEAVGFDAAPRVLGIDEEGREILTHLPGQSGAAGWAMIVEDEGLERLARLLRAYHEAVRSYRPRAGTVWASADRPLADGEIICHSDFGPWNVVWRARRPVGLIDWDLAGPGLPIDDVAYALEYAAPFRDDEMALCWLAYERPPDRRQRIERFASAYGLTTATGLVDQVIRRQRLTLESVRTVAERGVEPQVTWVANGYLDQLEARAVWTERHRSFFE